MDCAHADASVHIGLQICSKGHKPRFYMPRDELDLDWGWKRKCTDFQERVPVGIEVSKVEIIQR